MKTTRAFAAGVIGGILMSAQMAVARALGVPADLEMTLGTLTGAQPGAGPWILGFFMHLGISGVIGVGYAVAFEIVFHRASWALGLVVAIAHGLIAGTIMAFVPEFHPRIPGELPAPGAFMLNLGWRGFADLWVARFVYGATVGAIYGRRQ